MDEISIRELEEAVQNIDIRRFTSLLECYIKISALADRSLETSRPMNQKKIHKYDECCKDIVREASEILSQSSLSVNHVINFPFKIKGQGKGIPEIDRKTEFYLRKIKKQQMELLSALGDDVEIIRNMVKQSKEMRAVMQTHAAAIQKAAGLMEIMRERIAERPTTLLRVEGMGKKISELNETLRTMQEYENLHEEKIHKDAKKNPVNNALSAYHDIIQLSCTDIKHRKQRIQRRIKDFKEGGKLLLKLISKGYSPSMRKKLDKLLARHDNRIYEFQKCVREYREEYFKEIEVLPTVHPHFANIFYNESSSSGFELQ